MTDDERSQLIKGAAEKLRTTYHSANGKFATPVSAVMANRNGERLKVVRQLRKLSRAKKESQRTKAERLVLRSNLARAKATLLGAFTAPGFINISEVFGEK